MRTAAEAVLAAKRQVTNPTKDWYRQCLAFVGSCWAIPPSGIPDAHAGWDRSKKRRTGTSPPAGAPVYWGTSTVGHVAVSAGGGRVYSNDIKRRGKIDLVAIGTITKQWGATYRGWTADYCGNVDLPLRSRRVSLSRLVKAAKADPDRPQGGTTKGSVTAVKVVESALRSEGLLPSGWARDGSFGSMTVDAYARWQRRCGYRGKSADGIPGEASLRKLGAKYGFDVIA